MVSSLKSIIIPCRFLFFAGVFILLATPFLYMILRNNLIEKKRKSLHTTTTQSSAKILKVFEETEKNIHKVFRQPEIVDLIEKLIAAQQDNSITTDKDLYQQCSIALQMYKPMLEYKNCVIATPNGTILFSDNPVYTSLSLQDKKFQDSVLGHSLYQVMLTLTTDIAEFSYDPFIKAPALFITVPFFLNKKLHALIAIQLNENKIYAITNNYIGLGTTGELSIAKHIESGTLYLDETRHNLLPPFKKFIPASYTPNKHLLSPMQQATLGYVGSGVIKDSNNILCVASWRYIPECNFGMEAKIDYQEVVSNLSYFIVFVYGVLFLLFIICCIEVAYDRQFFQRVSEKFSGIYQKSAPHLLTCIWLISCIIFIVSLYHHYSLYKNNRQKMETSILERTTTIQQKIDALLHTTQLITQNIVYDLKFNRWKKEQLTDKLEQELKNNPFISGISIAYAPYAYESDKKLFGRFVTHTETGKIETFNLDELYDYTSETIINAPHRMFYVETLKKNGVVWIEPTLENLSKKFIVGCSEDAHETENGKDKLIAVITVFIDVKTISDIIESIAINTTSPSYLLSNTGAFIYHPNASAQNTQQTILDSARETASPELITLWEKRQKHLNTFLPFYEESTQTKKVVLFKPLKTVNWFMCLVLSDKVFLLSTLQLRHYYMTLLFFFTLFLICSLLVVSRLRHYLHGNYLSSAYIFLFPLLMCFILLLYISYSYQSFQKENVTPLTDTIQLDQFLTEKREIAKIIHEKPLITIPTGIEVNALDFKGAQSVKVSGLIWQKYDDVLHKDIRREIFFKDAFEGSESELIKKYETRVGTTTIIGWTFSIKIPFYMHEKLYPLDSNQISFAMEHPDLDKNILLTPDLEAYESMLPNLLPGITSSLKILGFDLKDSFFTFDSSPIKSTRGAESFGQSTSYIALRFNITTVRTILYALLVFFLPIFIIMFAIYAFFILGEKMKLDAEHMLTAYTGFLLTIIFLHRSLREQTTTGTVMYIEYFFFLTYFMIFALILNTLLDLIVVTAKDKTKKFKDFYKNFFWELQLLMSIIITTIIFY